MEEGNIIPQNNTNFLTLIIQNITEITIKQNECLLQK